MTSTPQTESGELMQLLQLIGQVPGIDVSYFVKELLKRHKWIDVAKAFPVANQGQPMTMVQAMRQPPAEQGQVKQNMQSALQNLGVSQ